MRAPFASTSANTTSIFASPLTLLLPSPLPHLSCRYVLQLFKLADRDTLGAITSKNRRMGLGFLNMELGTLRASKPRLARSRQLALSPLMPQPLMPRVPRAHILSLA